MSHSLRLFTTLMLNAVLCLSVYAESTDHESRSFPPSVAIGTALPNLGLPYVGPTNTVIVVRYLGFSCTHCVRQLTYLNSYARRLSAAGIRVVAFSSDDDRTNMRLVRRMGYDTSVITLVSDPDNRRARDLDLLRTVDGEQLDLHAALVVRNGILTFGILSTQPFMDVARLVQAAVVAPTTQLRSGSSLSHYVQGSVRPRVVASAADGIVSPVDLKFNRTLLHSNDLWVVTSPDVAAGMAILHNAGTSSQTITLKRDSRASHFMYRTQALAFGSNGTFATAQSGWPGGGYPNYMFMGPTLWSSDTAIFASLYQDSRNRLASHLDMLHQSPWCLGIAHERDNVYWVTDARYNTVHRYDFADPHEVGGTDHRDGVIRRYTEATITTSDREQPAHMAIDDATGWLYYVDPGAGRVQRLRISSGSVTGDLEMPEESGENLTEFSEVRGATIETAIAGPLGQPVGLDIRNGMMIVGDRATGRISMYRLSEDQPELIGTVATGAGELLGITIGPDDHIWCVDRANASVIRLETAEAAYVNVTSDVAVVDTTEGSVVFVDLVNDGSAPVRFSVEATVGNGWQALIEQPEVTVAAQSTERIGVVVRRDTSAMPAQMHIGATVRPTGAGDDVATPAMGRVVHLVPSNLRRVLVLDGTTEGFDIDEALMATNRQGYVALSSLVFNRAAGSLGNLETCVWFSGSFGDISVTDEAIIADLRRKNVDMLMLADDPFAIRAEGENSAALFQVFGAVFGGIDAPTSVDNGRRVYDGVANDPVTNGITLVDCQLPRLDHHRGESFVPSVFFRTAGTGSSAMLRNRTTQRAMAIRYVSGEYRSIVMGINPARMLDEQQRTTILDKSIEWLEGAAPKPVDPDPTSVTDRDQQALALHVLGNPVRTSTTLRITTTDVMTAASVALYSVGGQELRRLYDGVLDGVMEFPVDATALASGTYFIIVRTPTSIHHVAIIKD